MNTFSHSGDLGDLIYALPVVRGLGGGQLVLFPAAHTGHRMTAARAAVLAPLLRVQPYVTGVEWAAGPAGVNLDVWRDHYKSHLNLTDMACETFGLPYPPRDRPWLVAEPRPAARVVFHRSARYRNPAFPWGRVWELYRRDAVFVGLPGEHHDFCTTVGPVGYVHTETMLDLARVIAGAELFVGNQSAPFAVAEGLKVPTVLELCLAANNCHWERRGAVHGWGADVRLPAPADLPARRLAAVVGRAAGRTPLTEDGLTVLARAARDTAHLPGDMAEVGTCQGGSAVVIAAMAPQKTLHLFDTFRGLPAEGDEAGAAAVAAAVRDFLSGYEVAFHVGVFPDTAGNLPPAARFSFAHLATDTYEAARAAIGYFWPRLVPGGILVFDHYGRAGEPGVARAVAEDLPGVTVWTDRRQAWVRKGDRPGPRPTRRTPVFERALQLFRARGGKRIVELGSIRDVTNADGDGHATLLFAAAAAEVYSVDTDPCATALTRRLTADFETVSAVTMDGARFLAGFELPIDLLYLDAFDAHLPGSADWHLTAFRAAQPNLRPGSLVLIDDAQIKGEKVVPAAVAAGWEVVFAEYLTLLALPAGPSSDDGPTHVR